jgi:hypothetical protein
MMIKTELNIKLFIVDVGLTQIGFQDFALARFAQTT